jgi:hypothetical protein
MVNLYYIGNSLENRAYIRACEQCAQNFIHPAFWYVEVAVRDTRRPCHFCEFAEMVERKAQSVLK